MAQVHFLNEDYGWYPCAKFRTPHSAEVNVYERGQEMIVVTWIRGFWTATFSNGNGSISEGASRRGDALSALRAARPAIANKPQCRLAAARAAR